MSKEKRRFGDRRDATLIRQQDGMHLIMPMIYPNRCDNEAFISERIDLTNIDKYLEKRNAENRAKVIVLAEKYGLKTRSSSLRFSTLSLRRYSKRSFCARSSTALSQTKTTISATATALPLSLKSSSATPRRRDLLSSTRPRTPPLTRCTRISSSR